MVSWPCGRLTWVTWSAVPGSGVVRRTWSPRCTPVTSRSSTTSISTGWRPSAWSKRKSPPWSTRRAPCRAAIRTQDRSCCSMRGFPSSTTPAPRSSICSARARRLSCGAPTCSWTDTSSRPGRRQTEASLNEVIEQGRRNLGQEIQRFAANTLEYVQREKHLVTELPQLPEVREEFRGRHALVVVRGEDHRDDLVTLRHSGYIREVRPVVVAVDGGADALLEIGVKPHIVIGRLRLRVDVGADVRGAAHRARLPRWAGARRAARLDALGLSYDVLESAGTSEDIALLLAHDEGGRADRRRGHPQLARRLPRQRPRGHGLHVPGAPARRSNAGGRPRGESALPPRGGDTSTSCSWRSSCWRRSSRW